MIRYTTLSRRRALLLFAVCLTLLLSACGKKGRPVPKDPARNFTWQSLEATPSGNCLAFSGTLAGAYSNLESLRLEIAPVTGADDCPGCPFVPKEVISLSRDEAGFNQENGGIGFSYCPKPAPAHRWRLAGVSTFNRLPHNISPVKMTIMDQQAVKAFQF